MEEILSWRTVSACRVHTPVDAKSLSAPLPPLASEEHYASAISEIEAILEKGERNIPPEENELLDLLTNLVRDYESRTYPPLPQSKPHELVAFLLEQGGHSAKALWPILGSKSRVSELLAGKRAVSKLQAKKLAEFFHLPLHLFIG